MSMEHLQRDAATLHRQGRLGEAAALYRRALAARPDDATALAGLGVLLWQCGEPGQGLGLLARAADLRPGDVGVQNNLGVVLLALRRTAEAVERFRLALRLDPGFDDARFNLGCALSDQGLCGEAAGELRAVLARRPESDETVLALAVALRGQGLVDESAAVCRELLARRPESRDVRSALLVSLNYSDAVSREEVFAESLAYGEACGEAAAPRFLGRAQAGRRLRVGYLSPDFHGHPVAAFFEPLLAAHDRSAVQIFCYADVAAPDAVTARLRAQADRWRDARGMDDERLAELIRGDRIDVLVDLTGHMPAGRLSVLARRPAPVQVSWLGYPNTTGLPAADWRFTDAAADPEGDADRFHSERLWRLPRFLPYAPPPEDRAPLRPRREGPFRFCCFNNPAKISPSTVQAWARILLAVPGSLLVLKYKTLSDPAGRRRLLDLFAASGVGEERLDLRGGSLPRAEHLDLYNDMDLALDPFPYNGTTTTCEALWMGVPVLALAGDRHAARVGASLLTAAGREGLIARDVEEYAAKAVALASDPERLAAERAAVSRRRLAASPLFDVQAFARSVEAAYGEMRRRAQDVWPAEAWQAEASSRHAPPGGRDAGPTARSAGERDVAPTAHQVRPSTPRMRGPGASGPWRESPRGRSPLGPGSPEGAQAPFGRESPERAEPSLAAGGLSPQAPPKTEPAAASSVGRGADQPPRRAADPAGLLRRRRLALARRFLAAGQSDLPTLLAGSQGDALRESTGSDIRALPWDEAEAGLVRDILARPDVGVFSGAFLAAMLFLPAFRFVDARLLFELPAADWLWAFLLRPPSFFFRPGEADDHARFMDELAGTLLDRLERDRRDPAAREAGRAFLLGHDLLAVYSARQDLSGLFAKRAAICRIILAEAGYDLESRPASSGPAVQSTASTRPARSAPASSGGRARRRVCVLLRSASRSTETRATLPLLEGLDRDRFEVALAALHVPDDSFSRRLTTLADRVLRLPEDLNEQVRLLREQDFDLVFFGNNLAAAPTEPFLLACHRLAPLQMAHFCQPLSPWLPTIDLFLLGRDMDAEPEAAAGYRERLVRAPGSGVCFSGSEEGRGTPSRRFSRAALGLGASTTLLVSGANFHKLSPEARESFARIAARAGDAALALYPFGPAWASSYPAGLFVREMRRTFARHGVPPDRLLLFEPFPSEADVAALLSVCDVYLDAFPYSGATSLIDPLRLGLPVAAMEGGALRFRQGAAILRELGLDDLVARDAASYEALAVELAISPARRAAARRRIEAAMAAGPRFLDGPRFGADVGRALLELWESEERRAS